MWRLGLDIGGGLSNLQRLSTDLPRAVQPYLFTEGCRTRLLPARYGDSRGVRGTAWLPDRIPESA